MFRTIKIIAVMAAFFSVTCSLISLMVIGPDSFGMVPQLALFSSTVFGMIAFAAWMTEDMM